MCIYDACIVNTIYRDRETETETETETDIERQREMKGDGMVCLLTS
jgi:hypothetical protein